MAGRTTAVQKALRQLESAGTAQNRKVYARHGVKGPMFGVSFGDLKRIAKPIGIDQDLAEALWNSGNHDARILATMVADPAAIEDRVLEAWSKDLDNYVVTDAFSDLTARSRLAKRKMEKWTKSNKEWIGAAGWTILAKLAAKSPVFEDDDLAPFVDAIESDIHSRKNRVRYSMNNALIAIGLTSPSLKKRALQAAKKIGAVQVDHGKTGCKTPDAAEYIKKASARRAGKK